MDESGFCSLITPASLWPLIAEVADDRQVEALAKVIADPEKGVVEVTASKDFTLVLFDRKIECKSGRQLLSCKNFRTKGL